MAAAESVPLIAGRHGPKHSSGFYLTNLLHLSMSFFLVFTAFSGIQNIESSFIKVPHVGFVAIAVLYFVFTVSCLVTPALVSVLGARWSVTLAFICFVLFCVANVLVVGHPDSAPLAWGGLLSGGALVGIAASFLWTAQGTYMTSCAFHYARACGKPTKSALGLFSGLFWGIFQLTQISGNLLESLIFKKGSSPVPLFVVYLGCAGLGTLLAAFLRTVTVVDVKESDKDDASDDGDVDGALPGDDMEAAKPRRSASFHMDSSNRPDKKEKPGFVELLLGTVRLWRNPKMVLLIPLLFLSGLEQGWVFGDFTKAFIAPSLGKENIGYVMACFGAVDALSSFALGKLSDVVGRPPILILGFLCQTTVCVILFLVDIPADAWGLLIGCAALWGLGDASWNTQISAILGDLFSDNLDGAFANFKLWQSLLMGTAFLLGTLLAKSPHTYLGLLVGFLVVATICVLAALAIHKRDSKK